MKSKKVKFATIYGNKHEHKSPGGGERITKQSFADQCDINSIMERYKQTGTVPAAGGRPFFGDFSNAMDYATAQMSLAHAHEDFMALPAEIRTRFENKPKKLLEFLDNPENEAEARELGLLEPETDAVDVRITGQPENGSNELETGSEDPQIQPKEEN